MNLSELVPDRFSKRLSSVGRDHGHRDAISFANHLVQRRLDLYEIPASLSGLEQKLDHVVDEQGYADREELIEHLIERGLRAYEAPAGSKEDLEARLRGLGYID